jgi:hypothetical protein
MGVFNELTTDSPSGKRLKLFVKVILKAWHFVWPGKVLSQQHLMLQSPSNYQVICGENCKAANW